jgi:broad specificity phosphatase PhoE
MNRASNYVLVTHGISIRVLLARYFRYTIDQFNILSNPRNCEMVVLGHSGDGKLELNGRCQLEVQAVEEQQKEGDTTATASKTTRVTGYKFHKRLRILPKEALRKVKIRISPDEIKK